MKFIELVGNPGAGKTTIMANLVAKLNEESNMSFLTSDEALFYAAKENIDFFYRIMLKILPKSLAKPLCSKIDTRSFWQLDAQGMFFAENCQALQCVISSNVFLGLSLADKAIVLSSFQKAGGLLRCIKQVNSPKTYTFFDEGLIQKSMMFVSPNLAPISCANLHQYLSAIPQPDFVIHIKLDKEQCYDRMKGRLKGLTGRLQGCSMDEIDSFFTHSSSHWRYVIDWIEKKSQSQLISVCSSAKLETTVANIADQMLPLLCNFRR